MKNIPVELPVVFIRGRGMTTWLNASTTEKSQEVDVASCLLSFERPKSVENCHPKNMFKLLAPDLKIFRFTIMFKTCESNSPKLASSSLIFPDKDFGNNKYS